MATIPTREHTLTVEDNAVVRADWRMLRLRTGIGEPLFPGQWLRLATDTVEDVFPVHHWHEREGWTTALLPPGHRFHDLSRGQTLRLLDVCGHALPAVTGQSVLLGAGLGIGPILAHCEHSSVAARFVALGDARGVPLRVIPSRFVIAGLPPPVMAGAGRLEELGVPSRIAVPGEIPGCHDGDATDLLRLYLAAIPEIERGRLELIAASPWHALARWRDELARPFASSVLMELPAVSDGPPPREY